MLLMVIAIPFMLCAIPCIALCKGKGGDAHGAGHGNHEGEHGGEETALIRDGTGKEENEA